MRKYKKLNIKVELVTGPAKKVLENLTRSMNMVNVVQNFFIFNTLTFKRLSIRWAKKKVV